VAYRPIEAALTSRWGGTGNKELRYTRKSSWRWYINTITDFLILSIVLSLFKKRLGDWTPPLSSGKKTTQLGPIGIASPYPDSRDLLYRLAPAEQHFYLRMEVQYNLQNVVLNKIMAKENLKKGH
jgi:hypothetical protein